MKQNKRLLEKVSLFTFLWIGLIFSSQMSYAFGYYNTLIKRWNGNFDSSKLCLDAESTGGNVINIRQMKCHNNRALFQKFQVQGDSIVHPPSALCLSFSGVDPTAGANIQLSNCHGGSDQKFRVQAGKNAIKHIASGKCLDISGGGHAENANVILWDCHGKDNQQFVYVTPYAHIKAAGNNSCLDLANSGTDNYTNLQLHSCNKTVAQTFEIHNQYIVNPQSSKCLDVGSGTNGHNAYLYQCNNTAAQRFSIEGQTIKHIASGRCLDRDGGGTANGTNIQLWDCHGGSHQRFNIQEANIKPKFNTIRSFANVEDYMKYGDDRKKSKYGVRKNPSPSFGNELIEHHQSFIQLHSQKKGINWWYMGAQAIDNSGAIWVGKWNASKNYAEVIWVSLFNTSIANGGWGIFNHPSDLSYVSENPLFPIVALTVQNWPGSTLGGTLNVHPNNDGKVAILYFNMVDPENPRLLSIERNTAHLNNYPDTQMSTFMEKNDWIYRAFVDNTKKRFVSQKIQDYEFNAYDPGSSFSSAKVHTAPFSTYKNGQHCQYIKHQNETNIVMICAIGGGAGKDKLWARAINEKNGKPEGAFQDPGNKDGIHDFNGSPQCDHKASMTWYIPSDGTWISNCTDQKFTNHSLDALEMKP